MTDKETRGELLHPRITKAYAQTLIAKERIVIDEEMAVTICIVKLINGHRIVTEAIVGNEEKFDPKRGTRIAKRKAIDEIIRYELYNLRSKLTEQTEKVDEHADRR